MKTYIKFLIVLILTGLNNSVFAHCDTYDGPVIKAAQKSLETSNINYVLIWVKPGAEKQITEHFNKVINVRKTNKQVEELADTYFFETLVRLHREGEGEPNTGIKPKDTETEPIIILADNAIDKENLDSVLVLFHDSVKTKIKDAFQKAISKKNYKTDDVKAGREYVEAYVTYVHLVENYYNKTSESEHHHGNTEMHETVVGDKNINKKSDDDAYVNCYNCSLYLPWILVIVLSVTIIFLIVIIIRRRKKIQQ